MIFKSSRCTDGVKIPKLSVAKPKEELPSGRGKARIAYGFYFQTELEAETVLKEVKAMIERKLGRKCQRRKWLIIRKGLKKKLLDPNLFDVVYLH